MIGIFLLELLLKGKAAFWETIFFLGLITSPLLLIFVSEKIKNFFLKIFSLFHIVLLFAFIYGLYELIPNAISSDPHAADYGVKIVSNTLLAFIVFWLYILSGMTIWGCIGIAFSLVMFVIFGILFSGSTNKAMGFLDRLEDQHHKKPTFFTKLIYK